MRTTRRGSTESPGSGRSSWRSSGWPRVFHVQRPVCRPVPWCWALTTPTEQVFYGWMATKRTPTGWAIRCEGCDRTDAMDAATTAQETLAEATSRGWNRPRPGLNDYCPTCLDARC